jgi:hypothetical protein
LYLTFPVALVGLSVLLAGGIALSVLSGHADDTWIVLPVVGVLAVGFLVVYSRRPGPERRAPTPPAPGDDEPFEDPVEEADRSDSAPIFASSDPASQGGPGPGVVAPEAPEGIPPGAPGLDEPSP